MPKNSYTKAKGRRESGPFVPLPKHVIKHPNFNNLRGSALKLLMYMCSQLHFKEGGSVNNGDISAAMTIMKKYGWKSNETLNYALKELLYYEFIMITRQGGRNKCSLYAVTWWAIDECKGKLDVNATRVPPGNWKEVKTKWERPKRKTKSVHRKHNIISPIYGAIG